MGRGLRQPIASHVVTLAVALTALSLIALAAVAQRAAFSGGNYIVYSMTH